MINTTAVRNRIVDLAIRGTLTNEFHVCANAKSELEEQTGRSFSIINKVPYSVKDNWLWVRLGDIVADTDYPFADGPFGSNLKKEHYTDEKQVRIIQLSNIGELGWKNENERYTTFEHLKTIQRSEVQTGDIVIAKMMPAGRAVIVPDVSEKYVLSSDCVKFVPHHAICREYLYYAINSPMFRAQVVGGVHGIGRERTSLSKLKTYMVPIPPKSEQKIIVDKLNTAFKCLSSIDDAQTQYSHNYSVLKDKIVEAGISGNLTEQRTEDGNAEDLYIQIQAEKASLIKEGKIKKGKPIPEIAREEIPFDIPESWKWVRFADLYSLSNGVASRGTEGGKPHPVLRLADLIGGKIETQNIREISLTDAEYESHKVQKGDLVFIRVNGSRSKVANAFLYLEDGEISYCDHLFCGHKTSTCVDPAYIMMVVKSEMVKRQIEPYIKTTAGQNTISQGNMGKIIIPLPPQAEQKRIVKKVNALLAAMPE